MAKGTTVIVTETFRMKYGKVSMSILWSVYSVCVCVCVYCVRFNTSPAQKFYYYEGIGIWFVCEPSFPSISQSPYEPNMFYNTHCKPIFFFQLISTFAIHNNFRDNFHRRFWCTIYICISSIRNKKSQWPFVLIKCCFGMASKLNVILRVFLFFILFLPYPILARTSATLSCWELHCVMSLAI